MTTYVAMLRAVNVGGRVVAMADLRAAFTDMGYSDARSYIQTGNVVFGTSASPTKVQSAIEHGLEARFGHGITVVLRSGAQLAAITKHNPLLGAGRDPKRLHVTFLASTPQSSRVGGLDTEAFLPDEFRLTRDARSTSTAPADTAGRRSTTASSSAPWAWWRPRATGTP